MKVRRIVTGHNASGLSAVKTDEVLPGVSRGIAGITGWELWSTDQMPVDNSAAADAAQRAGFVKHLIPNYVGTGGGTTFRIDEIAPGAARFTHRTETVDYCIQLSRHDRRQIYRGGRQGTAHRLSQQKIDKQEIQKHLNRGRWCGRTHTRSRGERKIERRKTT